MEQKNLPDLVRTPSFSTDSHVFPYYQEISNPEPETEPEMYAGPEQGYIPSSSLGGARTPRTRFDVEKEVSDIKLLMRRLGEGVRVALDSLSPGEGGERDEERQEEAQQSLAYIQRVLSGSIDFSSVDPVQVLGKTEYTRRREERAEQERIRVEREQAEKERVEREREQAERDRVERERVAREREQAQREKQREREQQQAQVQEPDPLQASPSVRPAVLQTSPPRVRTTRVPWERSEHATSGLGVSLGGSYPPSVVSRTRTPPVVRTATPPVMRAHTPPVSRTQTPPAHQRHSSASSIAQPKPGPQPVQPGPSDPLGAGTLN